MSATFATIRAKIKSELEEITDIAFVFDHHRAELDGYPAITFDLSDQENDFLTDAENIRMFSFLIIIYQETTIKNLDEATDLLDNVADQVMDKFEGNFSLDGSVVWCNPLVGTRQMFETPQGLVVTQQMTLKCNFDVLVG